MREETDLSIGIHSRRVFVKEDEGEQGSACQQAGDNVGAGPSRAPTRPTHRGGDSGRLQPTQSAVARELHQQHGKAGGVLADRGIHGGAIAREPPSGWCDHVWERATSRQIDCGLDTGYVDGRKRMTNPSNIYA